MDVERKTLIYQIDLKAVEALGPEAARFYLRQLAEMVEAAGGCRLGFIDKRIAFDFGPAGSFREVKIRLGPNYFSLTLPESQVELHEALIMPREFSEEAFVFATANSQLKLNRHCLNSSSKSENPAGQPDHHD